MPNEELLWWSLLFGGCYGGNWTMIGSTANIVALGVLEHEKGIKITFFEWFKKGSIILIIYTYKLWFMVICTFEIMLIVVGGVIQWKVWL